MSSFIKLYSKVLPVLLRRHYQHFLVLASLYLTRSTDKTNRYFTPFLRVVTKDTNDDYSAQYKAWRASTDVNLPPHLTTSNWEEVGRVGEEGSSQDASLPPSFLPSLPCAFYLYLTLSVAISIPRAKDQ